MRVPDASPRSVATCALVAFAALSAVPVSAQTASVPPPAAVAQVDTQQIKQELDRLRQEFEAIRESYGARLAALEARLGGAAPAAAPQAPAAAPAAPATVEVPAGAAGAGGPQGALPVYGGTGATSKIFNPDIAVTGNFLGRRRAQHRRAAPSVRAAGGGGLAAGDCRSVRASGLLPRRIAGGAGDRGGVPHVPDASRRAAREGRTAEAAVRQGEHPAHALARVGGYAARDARTCSAARKA